MEQQQLLAEIGKLDTIKAYGETTAWAPLVIDGEEIIPAGRSRWLDFLWLSNKKDQQRRAYEWVTYKGGVMMKPPLGEE